jgi:hypothetical protein
MLQSLATPINGHVSEASPAWHKASCQKRAATESPSLVGWLAAAALTVVITAGVLALLVAEYAVLWAVLVAPWLDCVPATLPWAY